jgi:hypothetical protein
MKSSTGRDFKVICEFYTKSNPYAFRKTSAAKKICTAADANYD